MMIMEVDLIRIFKKMSISQYYSGNKVLKIENIFVSAANYWVLI